MELYSKILDFPKEIMIEATNYCNHRCFFCGSTVSKRPRCYIEPDLALKLINEAYSLGCRKISFHGMGEPFLCKDLPSFVREAKKLGYEYIYLDTNGSLATPGVVDPVLDAGLDSLKFSIHASTAETYYKITNNDCFDKVYENAKYISRYIKDHKLKCKTIAYFALSTINESESEEFEEMMKPYFSEVWVMPIHNGSGVKPGNEKYAVDTSRFEPQNKWPCFEMFSRLIINCEGKAIACCTDWTGNLVYGDTHTESLEEIWNNETIRRLRQMHQTADTLPPVCRSCMGL